MAPGSSAGGGLKPGCPASVGNAFDAACSRCRRSFCVLLGHLDRSIELVWERRRVTLGAAGAAAADTSGFDVFR